MNTLIAYYSRSGNTKKVAEAISKAIGGDLEEITEPRSRAGILGFLQSGREAQEEKMSTINPLRYDPTNYDLLIVGIPVWAGKLSGPIRTYLIKAAGKIKKVAYFATLGGKDVPAIFVEMEKITGHPEATLIIPAGEIKDSAYIDKAKKFVEILKKEK